ncbi:histidine phosphatase family protein [Tropicimonas isoalkanivorans]|uniref:Broad specificity phosphatase PhoE n=1 Tax=Tropicimonas isoalkanivorans TaxID=441112 RepID=A0A1I1R158_9RHOB|nr:histidine phosphatase family protein [Tropicimonas isoalkanivorans]SFD27967.1 Broad specificity phosphatase PhoE [Tropicimonas isoalkanivorans]
MGRLHLVRHGQASFGADDYDVLSDLGARQAARAGAVLPRDARAFSGTLRRHLDSATAAGFAVAQADPAWNEFDYLDVIGVAHPGLGSMAALRTHLAHEPAPLRAFQALYEDAVARWMEGGAGPYREPRRDFVARVQGTLDRAAGDGDAVVFTSGGVISAIVAGLLELTPMAARRIDRVLVNAGITTLATGRRGPQLLALNAQTHLQEDGFVTYR